MACKTARVAVYQNNLTIAQNRPRIACNVLKRKYCLDGLCSLEKVLKPFKQTVQKSLQFIALKLMLLIRIAKESSTKTIQQRKRNYTSLQLLAICVRLASVRFLIL